MSQPSHPTNVELAILRVLWETGSAPVGVIHNALKDQRKASYSTTLKMIQVMFDKGLLVRDESVRPHLYRPAISQEETQGNLVDDLVQKAFGGAAEHLVVQALSSRRISRDELANIRKLIDQLEQEGDEP
jgi:predicted transcriptional regulator